MHLEALARSLWAKPAAGAGEAAAAAGAEAAAAAPEAAVANQRGLELLVLASRLLHGARYPATAAAFEAGGYARWTAGPLARVLADPVFAVVPRPFGPGGGEGGGEGGGDPAAAAAAFADGSFRPELAGRRVPRPVAMVPATALASAGNTRATWRELLGRGQLTPGQAAANLRSLVLLDVAPTDGPGAALAKAGPPGPFPAPVRIEPPPLPPPPACARS